MKFWSTLFSKFIRTIYYIKKQNSADCVNILAFFANLGTFKFPIKVDHVQILTPGNLSLISKRHLSLNVIYIVLFSLFLFK